MSIEASENRSLVRKFTHLVIPSQIWLLKNISCTAKCLWAELYSLHDDERGGCFASEEYLCEFLDLKRAMFYRILKELKDAELLEIVSNNGRSTVRKALMPKEVTVCRQLVSTKVDCTSLQKYTAPVYKSRLAHIESKEESKVERGTQEDAIASTNTQIAAPVPLSFGKFVKLSEAEHAHFVRQLGAVALDELIAQMNDYCAASRPKGYLDYASAMRMWIRRDKNTKTGTVNGYSKAKTVRQTIAERQLADYEKHNGSFDRCVKTYD